LLRVDAMLEEGAIIPQQEVFGLSDWLATGSRHIAPCATDETLSGMTFFALAYPVVVGCGASPVMV
jgi:hypothetical protein